MSKNLTYKEQMNEFKERSGNITIDSKLVSFIYTLLIQYPAGDIEEIVMSCQESNVNYTNGYLAKYAEDIANRLLKTD
jgi:hypothetical protein